MEKKKLAEAVWPVAASLLLLGGTVAVSSELSFPYQMPVQLTLSVNAADCDKSPGPFVTLEGEIALGGLQAQFMVPEQCNRHAPSRRYGEHAGGVGSGR